MSQRPSGFMAYLAERFPPRPEWLLRRVNKIKIFRPLRERDYAFLAGGTFVSFLGDGIFFVAVPWQTYQLSDSPFALAMVELAWVAPMVLLLLVSGMLSDRIGRRRMMIAGDLLRIAATAALGFLSVTGVIEIWHMVGLMVLYGAGSAIFYPSFLAITPELVPEERLVEANALTELMQPFGMQLFGPALGGFAIGVWGVGWAFAIDSASFLFSIGAVLAMRTRKAPQRSGQSALQEVAEGFRFARKHTWIWAILVSATLALLMFHGPFEVLVPFVIKEKLGGSAGQLGMIFSAGGAGAVLASIVMAQRGLPKKPVTFMLVMWTIAVGSVAAYAFITEPWQGMIPFFVLEATAVAGMVVWTTMLQRKVPKQLLGRIMSLDWFAGTALMPVSLALTGPLSAAFGVEAVLVGAGVLSAIATISFMWVPGVRDIEKGNGHRLDELAEPELELSA